MTVLSRSRRQKQSRQKNTEIQKSKVEESQFYAAVSGSLELDSKRMAAAFNTTITRLGLAHCL